MSHDLSQQYRTAMRRFASTVSIATCSNGADWAGTTVTAVASVSAEPAALLVCVNRTSSLYSALQHLDRFCINVLRRSHADLADVFAGRVRGRERFAFGRWEASEEGPPYLADAQANLFCLVDRVIDYATHAIFIGRVERVRFSADVAPLIHQNGAYVAATAPQIPAIEEPKPAGAASHRENLCERPRKRS